MSKLLRISILMGLFVALASLGSFAQEFEDFSEDEFSEVELDEVELSDDEFDDVEFDDDEVADEEFEDADDEVADEEFEDADDLEIENADDIEEEVADEKFIDEPISDDLTPPAVAEEEEEAEAEDLFSSPVASDEPNLDLEAKLHGIYTRFHKNKTAEDDWQSIVGQRITEVYTIQKDDKLWEISRTLFGDGNYWPKVWSLNSSIRNPHLISPKNKIQFVLGDESGPPAFSISEEEEEFEEVAEEEELIESSGGEVNEPEIPPPLINSRPVVKRLPPSLPKWQVLGEQGGVFDELGIDYGSRKITKLENKIPLSAFVSEREPNPVGVISEMEAGSQIASTLQYIYVEMDSGSAQIGDTLLVIQNKGLVEKAHPSVTGFLGYSIEVQGEIQLVERVPKKSEKGKRKKKRSGRELYRAIVSRLVNPVSVGSSLIPGRVEYIEVSEKGPRSQVVAQFIGGQYFNKRRIYGAESVAFLNRGSDDGLEPGQILSVRENRTIRNENTLVRSNVRPIGWVRVVKVEPNLSTVIVVRAWSDILTGDLTGAGVFVPRTGQEASQKIKGEETASRTLLEELDEVPGASSSADESATEEEEDFGSEDFDE